MTKYIQLTILSLLLVNYVSSLNIKLSDNSSNQQPVSSTARILRSLGFMAEDHRVKVQNGTYFLSLVRATNPLINNGRGGLPDRDPLLFVHGIFVNANSFILNTAGVRPNDYTAQDTNSMSLRDLQELLRQDPASNSLVFTALNFGYEVWLLNRRPTLRSLIEKSNHEHSQDSMEPIPNAYDTRQSMEFDDSETLQQFATSTVANYWNFSFDEQASFDIPQTIDYVLSHTNRSKLTYVGHSAGGAVLLMSLVLKPELADKISKAILWAPALYLRGNFRLIFREFLLLVSPILARIIEPIPPPFLVVPIDNLIGIVCHSKLAQMTICDPLLDYVLGDGNSQSMVQNFNSHTRFFDMISSHEGAQLLQSNKKGRMHHFDYPNQSQNIIAYGQPEPPIYDVSKIRLKTMSFWAGITDIVVPMADVDSIIEDATVPIDRHIIGRSEVLFGHNAFFIHNNISNMLIIPSFKTILTKE